jgi:hypothetical protein
MQQKKKSSGDEYDRVYCVFDRDEHSSFDEASKTLKDNKFHAARSWPCFEFWLLLHYKYQRGPFSRQGNKTAAKVCESALKKQLPTYEKGMKGIFNYLLSMLDTGVENASKAQKDAVATEEPNPSTEVHELVQYLRGLKGRHRK